MSNFNNKDDRDCVLHHKWTAERMNHLKIWWIKTEKKTF